MEQVISLINRLEQQVRQGATTPEIFATTGLLRLELEQLLTESKPCSEIQLQVWLPSGLQTHYTSPLPIHEEENFQPMPKRSTSIPGP
jgi:hypothetical protein